jgi:hypothetical protein
MRRNGWGHFLHGGAKKQAPLLHTEPGCSDGGFFHDGRNHVMVMFISVVKVCVLDVAKMSNCRKRNEMDCRLDRERQPCRFRTFTFVLFVRCRLFPGTKITQILPGVFW